MQLYVDIRRWSSHLYATRACSCAQTMRTRVSAVNADARRLHVNPGSYVVHTRGKYMQIYIYVYFEYVDLVTVTHTYVYTYARYIHAHVE